jgi:hypothetical protein
VGWTRARDRLILAAEQGKLLAGLLGTLTEIEPQLIGDPGSAANGLVDATWAGHDFKVQVAAASPAEPAALQSQAGTVRVGRPLTTHAPASCAPSSSPSRTSRLKEPVRLGEPLKVRQPVDVVALGQAVHDFLAADNRPRSDEDRLEMATGLLRRYRVPDGLAAADLIEAGNRLWRWVTATFGDDCIVRTEWPIGLKLENGTRVLGTSDLLVEARDTWAIIDHKSFGLATATTNVGALAGQLGCYADALTKARPNVTVSMWVHLPFDGAVVQVE